MSTFRSDFNRLVEAARETIKNIDEMPADKVDKPLTDLRNGLQAALARYDDSASLIEKLEAAIKRK